MKISNMGVDYKVKRGKNCTGCAGYRTYDLCNELRAQFFGKVGFSCTKQGGAYTMVEILSRKRNLAHRLQARQMRVSDRAKHVLLVNFITYVSSCMLDNLVVLSYCEKIRIAFNLKPQGEQNERKASKQDG
jgi:hypothetical protein